MTRGATHQAAFEGRNWFKAELKSHLSKQICFKKRERESIWKDSMTNVDAQLELCLLGFGQLMGTKEAVC